MGDPVKKMVDPLSMLGIGGSDVIEKEVDIVKEEMAPPPGAPKPKVAPTPDEEASRIAKERMMKKKYGKSGRAGTMLTDGAKLG